MEQLTLEGFIKLREELDEINLVKVPRNVRAIDDARSQGDLSENADYQSAREEQTKLNDRKKEIEAILKTSEEPTAAKKEIVEQYQAVKAELDKTLIPAAQAKVDAIKANADASEDITKNIEYTVADGELQVLKNKSANIEHVISNVVLRKKSDKVTVGTHVKLTYVKLKKTVEYDIVGTVESDPFKGKVSNASPLGKKLEGHKKGDTVIVVAENGNEFEVIIEDVR